jgi:PPM family protein phosphatase
MKINVSYISHFGKIRKNNEDSILVNDLIISETNMDAPEKQLCEAENLTLAVADGMGGHSKGEIASRMVLEILKEHYKKFRAKRHVFRFFSTAKNMLDEVAKNDKKSLGLGTTLSGISLRKKKGIIFSCGDSRVYKITAGGIEKLTTDHSLVQQLFEKGIIQEEDMRTHPQKNIITASISGDMRSDKPTVFYKEVSIQIGDRFLLCTDGLWESLSPDEMLDCLNQKSVDTIAEALKEKSLTLCGKDNISLIYLEVLET